MGTADFILAGPLSSRWIFVCFMLIEFCPINVEDAAVTPAFWRISYSSLAFPFIEPENVKATEGYSCRMLLKSLEIIIHLSSLKKLI